MKSIAYLVVCILTLMNFAHAYTLDDLAGIYKLTSKKQIDYLDAGMSIEYKLAISTDKDEFDHNIVGINEYIMQKLENGTNVVVAELKCQGTAELNQEKTLISSVSCNGDKFLEQKIKLDKIANVMDKHFEALVENSLYGSEYNMQIERLRNIVKK